MPNPMDNVGNIFLTLNVEKAGLSPMFLGISVVKVELGLCQPPQPALTAVFSLNVWFPNRPNMTCSLVAEQRLSSL